MSNLAPKQKLMSETEYLAFEEKSKIRHEFMDGEIFSMAGVKRNHSIASTNISRVLGNQLLETNCEVHSTDFRVRVRNGHYVYPDIAVACNNIEIADNDTTLLNPTVIFEVLSKSTEKRDRGDKQEDYFNLESVKDYILVSQDRVKVEHYHREKNNKWTLQIHTNIDDTFVLDSIRCKISLSEIYHKLNITPLQLVKSNKKNGK
jgi:Uma2 family endonuclease